LQNQPPPEARLTPTRARKGVECPPKRFLVALRLSEAALPLVTLLSTPSTSRRRALAKKPDALVGRLTRERERTGGVETGLAIASSLLKAKPLFLRAPGERLPM